MAKIKGYYVQGRVKASTIMEVVISMVMIVVVIGIALMILSNVIRLSLSVKQIRAGAILQHELIKTTTTEQFNDEILQVNDWRIEKTFKPYNLGKTLVEADFSVYDQNNVRLAQLKSIVIHESKQATD